jgi:hypothetical protein
VDSCDLNQDTFNPCTRFQIIPEFGPPSGYLRRVPSEIRGSKFHSIDIVRDASGANLEAALNFQNLLKQYVWLWMLDLMIVIS